MLVTYQDAKELQYCNKGLRAGCEKYGLDYDAFKQDGLDSEVLLSFNDQMLVDLVNYAKSKGEQV